MTETSYFWAGTTDGDASIAPYTNDEISDVFRQLFQFDPTYTLPSIDYPFDNFDLPPEYKPFHIRLSQVSKGAIVYAGVALIDGKVYFNRSRKTFNCSQEGYYRIVLRKVFPAIVDDLPTGQTIKAVALYSQNWIDGTPLPTRTDGQTWEVTIAVIRNDAGTLSFYPTTKSHISKSYIASGISTEYGYRIMPEANICIPARRGGSATNWGTAGLNAYACAQSRIEVGSVEIAANPQAHVFAEAFPYTPVVVLTPYDSDGSTWSGNNLCISALSAAGFSIRFDNEAGLSHVHYLAIGPVS